MSAKAAKSTKRSSSKIVGAMVANVNKQKLIVDGGRKLCLKSANLSTGQEKEPKEATKVMVKKRSVDKLSLMRLQNLRVVNLKRKG